MKAYPVAVKRNGDEIKNTGCQSGNLPIHIQPNAVAIRAENLMIFVPKTACLPRIVVTVRIQYGYYDMEILDNYKY
jgi:hypothetical protein